MQQVRHKNDRGMTETSWLQSWHSFSFGEYRDRNNMGFGPLRVINEDVVAAGAGFHTHGHANMEIITYILSGSLEHKDSLDSGGVIRPGDVQLMSAGKGILHSEFNPSPDEEVHLLQIWIMPDETGTRPTYQQRAFPPEDYRNKLRLIVSRDGEDGSLKIKQDAKLWATRLDAGASVSFTPVEGKQYWLQVARGTIDAGDPSQASSTRLAAGDGFILKDAGHTVLTAGDAAEAILFELPY